MTRPDDTEPSAEARALVRKHIYSWGAHLMDALAADIDRFRAAGVREKEREIKQLTATNKMLCEMSDAAEEWYWANNRASLDTVGSKERVFDALRLLGRYPPPSKHIIEPEPPHD